MSASPKLPPTARDFLIYERVIIEGAATRAAAGEFGLSQTRIRQIVCRVVEWFSTTLPEDTDLDDDARLRYGLHLAADRLENLYRDAMADWRSTRQPKFANLASRLALAQSKLPAFAGTLEALAADAIEGPYVVPSGPEGTEAGSALHDESVPPPPRDCSPLPPSAFSIAAPSPAETNKTPLPEDVCDNRLPAKNAARSAFLAPAHPLSGAGVSRPLPVTELKITPETLGLSTKKTLTRKQRRRLRRMRMAK
jgi:hypothetical protein